MEILFGEIFLVIFALARVGMIIATLEKLIDNIQFLFGSFGLALLLIVLMVIRYWILVRVI